MKVLIVDDEAAIRDALADLLTEEGCVVAVTASGEEALVAACQDDYDVIFTDFELGKMNGIQLAEKVVRALPKKPKIILMTGSSITEVEAGPNISGIIRKPCGFAVFLNEVKQMSS
jgi:CheY-like chemotaxis protein